MQTAALYIRVSTDRQEELSPDAQKRLLLDYAEKHDMLVSSEFIFLDGGISGKRADKRPDFQQMIGLAKSKEHPFDVILVWKFSRFARNQEESIVYKSLLKKNNVDVISISEPLIDGPFGSLIERIIEWMDEYYSIRLSGEVTRGMTENAMRGRYQAKPPLGYEVKHPKEPPVIIPDQAVIVRAIFHKYVNDGLSLFQIAKYLNSKGYFTERGKSFERRGIEYIIQNPTYKGYIRWNRKDSISQTIKDKNEWIIEKGHHEAIISEELFDQAQDRFQNEHIPHNSRPATEYRHWLSGLIKCGNCGRSLTANKVNRSRYMQFICNGYSKGKCIVTSSVSENIINRSIMSTFEDIITTSNIQYVVIRSNSDSDISYYEQQLKKLSSKEERIKFSYMNGIDTFEEYKHNREIIAKERESIQNSIKELRHQNTYDYKNEMLTRVNNVYTLITDPSIDNITKNSAMKSILEKIVFNKSDGTFDYYFYYA